MAQKKITKTGVGFLIDASAKTYETIEKQIREFISNALDAGASKVDIKIMPDENRIQVIDNGFGMTEEEFDNNYLVIGCSNKYGDKNTIGRIGVGKFSSIPLSDSLTIRTKKEGSSKVYQAVLDLSQLKDPENRTKHVGDLTLGEGEYVESSLSDPDNKFSPKGCFTKITMDNVPAGIITKLQDKSILDELIRNLGMILPLEYSDSNEAINKLKNQDLELYEEIIQCSRAKKLDVKIYSPQYSDGKLLYRSLFGDDFSQTGEQIAGDLYVIKSPEDVSPAPVKIIGYLADMTNAKAAYNKWKGINVRVQNTTVVDHYFFDHSDAPADARITGEVHILNANEEELITMNRAGFVTSFEQYAEISAWLTKNLDDFASKYVRRRTDFKSRLKKRQKQLQIQHDVAVALERSSLNGFDDVNIDMKQLSMNELREEDEIDEVEALKEDFASEVVAVTPVPDATQENIHEEIKGNKFSLFVPDKFCNYESNIQGVDYKIRYVNHDEEEPVIDVDMEKKVIRVNKNSSAVKNGSHSMVMTFILMEMAFVAYGDDTNKLKHRLREVLKLAFSDD